jgi:hypothetical protein
MTGSEYRAAIEKLGMTIVRSADYFGVDRSAVFRWINGESPIPKSVQIVLRNEIARRDKVARPIS